MKVTNKFLNAVVVTAIGLFTAANISASFSFGGDPWQTGRSGQVVRFGSGDFSHIQPAPFGSPGNNSNQQPQSQIFSFPPTPQENLNWTTETATNLKQLTQVSKESTEIIKKLSDKVALLEDVIKVMQATIDTLKDTVSQNYSTTMKMLNEALKK